MGADVRMRTPDVRMRTSADLEGAVAPLFVGIPVALSLDMRWPERSVDRVRPSRFRPPFCPNPPCPAHVGGTPPRFHRHGFYRRASDGIREVRLICLLCGTTCTRRTFSFFYRSKRPDLPAPVAAGLVAGSAHRQIARSLRCAKTTVSRIADRLGRHARLFHRLALAHLEPLEEPVVHDHFETFVSRQDRALAIGTPVGAISWFLLGPDPAPHRGHGRRPDRKPDRSPPPRERAPYVASITRSLDLLVPLVPAGSKLRLVTDGRKDYRLALRSHPARDRFVLEAHPNPERGPKGSPRTPEAIARDRAMGPVDQLHQFVRHSHADHKRETIAFGRKVESVMGRAFLMTVWKNFIKGRSEKRPDRRTPAMLLGLADRPFTWERMLAKRLFEAAV